MVAPSNYDITITLNEVDITSYVPYESLAMDLHRREVSRLSLTVHNPSGVTPARGQTITVTADSLAGSPIVFTGYVMEVTSRKRSNGIVKEYDLECADRKIRLQKSVLAYNEYSGLDSDILSSLLSDTYPDLSDLFDFSSDVTSFANDLSLITDDTSLLDALNELADKADAEYRFDIEAVNGGLDFDNDFDSDNYVVTGVFGMSVAVTTGGNPGQCAKGTAATWTTQEKMTINIYLGELTEINDVTFDVYTDIISAAAPPRAHISLRSGGTWDVGTKTYSGGSLLHNDTFNITNTNATWDSLSASVDGDFWSPPYSADLVSLFLEPTHPITGGHSGADIRLDNINWGEIAGNTDSLQWDADPDLSDFNIDIDSGDEFAFDIDLYEGDWDDFNSITVIGGFEEVAIDWTYRASGQQEHINLETEIKDLVVYTNGGTDTTPSWGTALALGTFGTDTLTGDGGDKDVLYDPDKHWLWFDTNPPNLENSIRLTGSILKPIRVRVEDVADGDPTFATPITDTSVTTTDQAIAVGNAALKKNNAPRRLDFKTYEPGLKVGQSITVSDSNRGLSETLIIQTIKVKWIGSAHAIFDVQCGDTESTSLDSIVANNDKRSRIGVGASAPTITTYEVYTDNSGNTLTDDSGNLLYEVA
jgi:hypothetical protein